LLSRSKNIKIEATIKGNKKDRQFHFLHFTEWNSMLFLQKKNVILQN